MSHPTLAAEVQATLGASLVLGAVSTFGDWLWTHYIPDGAIIPGIAHGVIIFLVIAFVLAATARREDGADSAAIRRLLWALPVAGAVIAASFYPLYMVLGFLGPLARYLTSLLITWVAMWLVLAWLYAGASGGHEGTQRTLIRGALAAVGSGLAFWAISGIWTKAQPGGPNYLWHFACWSFAFLPGFAALFLLQKPEASEP